MCNVYHLHTYKYFKLSVEKGNLACEKNISSMIAKLFIKPTLPRDYWNQSLAFNNCQNFCPESLYDVNTQRLWS